MLIVTLHRWAGFRVARGLWTARTFGFVTVEIPPGAWSRRVRVYLDTTRGLA